MGEPSAPSLNPMSLELGADEAAPAGDAGELPPMQDVSKNAAPA